MNAKNPKICPGSFVKCRANEKVYVVTRVAKNADGWIAYIRDAEREMVKGRGGFWAIHQDLTVIGG
jgi:hypothetical protein